MRSSIRRVAAGAALALPFIVAAACGPSSSLQCGAGTKEIDGVCVSSAGETTGTSSGGGSGGVGGGHGGDGGASTGSSGTGAGGSNGLPKEGEPCPEDEHGYDLLGDQCSGDLLYNCWKGKVQVTDCAALGGACQMDEKGRNRCLGGPFTACDGSVYRHCFDATYLLLCDQGYWWAMDCAESFGDGSTCMKSPSTPDSACVPAGTVPCDPATTKDTCSADGTHRVLCSEGLLIQDPCADGKACSLTSSGDPVCVTPGAQPCQLGVDKGECVGGSLIVSCDISTQHYALSSCPTGTECQTSPTGWPECVAPGTPTCDPVTFPKSCIDGKKALWCDGEGFEETIDCAPDHCLGQGSCGVAEDCDPSTYTASCQGTTALNCHPFGYVVETTCGLVCSVQNGKAVCD